MELFYEIARKDQEEQKRPKTTPEKYIFRKQKKNKQEGTRKEMCRNMELDKGIYTKGHILCQLPTKEKYLMLWTTVGYKVIPYTMAPAKY